LNFNFGKFPRVLSDLLFDALWGRICADSCTRQFFYYHL